MELVCKSDAKTLETHGLLLERLNESDLELWFDHVAEVFATTGRGYFIDHYLAQPDLNDILVIKHAQTKQILSTCRFFRQHVILAVCGKMKAIARNLNFSFPH